MNFFNYRKNELHCEEVNLRDIVVKYGTPAYVYSFNTITQHYRHIIDSWKPLDVIVAYSMKANSNLAVISILRKMGSWIDAVSKGEIYRATSAGFEPGRIILGGVGKTADEIEYALKNRIFMIVADSGQELKIIDAIARKSKRKMAVGLRINPVISAGTHPYIATALKESKFGIPLSEAEPVCRYALTLRNVQIIAVQQHIGSQIIALKPFLEALTKTVDLVRRLKKRSIDIRYLDIGGGIGIKYRKEKLFTLEDYAHTISGIVAELDCRIIIEPGRVIVGNTGALLTRVLYVKKGIGKNFVIVDAGMNDLLRPALYGAYHDIMPLARKKGRLTADVVGPVCESGDFFARNRTLPGIRAGDCLAIMSAGAYGFSMASNYNSRPRPAEILVRGDHVYHIRKRERIEDLTRGEISYWF